MTVTTPDEVKALVDQLSQDTSEAAKIEHLGRERLTFEGESAPDHLLAAGVRGGYGYLEYVDDDHELCQPVGDPDSPVYHSDSDQYEAGTGVPIETFTKALKEFLATAQRPTCVEWREVL
jgi:hypothetical protein